MATHWRQKHTHTWGARSTRERLSWAQMGPERQKVGTHFLSPSTLSLSLSPFQGKLFNLSYSRPLLRSSWANSWREAQPRALQRIERPTINIFARQAAKPESLSFLDSFLPSGGPQREAADVFKTLSSLERPHERYISSRPIFRPTEL